MSVNSTHALLSTSVLSVFSTTAELASYLNQAVPMASSTYSRLSVTATRCALALHEFSPMLYYATVLAVLVGPVLSLVRWGLYKTFWAEANKVKGKQFLVTGACGALGTNLCIELAKKGAHTLVLWDVRDEALSNAASALQIEFPELRIKIKKVNFLSTQAIRDAAREIIQDNTLEIDVLVNVAGIFFSGMIAQSTDAEEHATIQVNYLAQAEMLKQFIPYMESKKKGHIVGVASVAAFNAGAGMASYCASKFALRAYYEAVACELAINQSPVSGFQLPLVPAMNATTVSRALVNMSIERRYPLSIFPVLLSPLPLASAILAALGHMLVIPINPLTNWKGMSYARETLGL